MKVFGFFNELILFLYHSTFQANCQTDHNLDISLAYYHQSWVTPEINGIAFELKAHRCLSNSKITEVCKSL